MAVNAHEKADGQHDIERRQARGPQQVARRERLARDNCAHALEHVGRRQRVGDGLHPPGQRGERIEHPHERGDQRRDRPDQPFRGRSQAQHDGGAEDAEGDAGEEQNQQEGHEHHAVGEERQAEGGAREHDHHDEREQAGDDAGEHQPGNVLRDRERRGEDVEEVARPHVLEERRGDAQHDPPEKIP